MWTKHTRLPAMHVRVIAIALAAFSDIQKMDVYRRLLVIRCMGTLKVYYVQRDTII